MGVSWNSGSLDGHFWWNLLENTRFLCKSPKKAHFASLDSAPIDVVCVCVCGCGCLVWQVAWCGAVWWAFCSGLWHGGAWCAMFGVMMWCCVRCVLVMWCRVVWFVVSYNSVARESKASALHKHFARENPCAHKEYVLYELLQFSSCLIFHFTGFRTLQNYMSCANTYTVLRIFSGELVRLPRVWAKKNTRRYLSFRCWSNVRKISWLCLRCQLQAKVRLCKCMLDSPANAFCSPVRTSMFSFLIEHQDICRSENCQAFLFAWSRSNLPYSGAQRCF